MNPSGNSVIRFVCALAIISAVFATPTTITAPPILDSRVVYRDDIKYLFQRCVHKKDVAKCLKKQVIRVLDNAIQNNDPLSVNLFNLNFSLNKNPKYMGTDMSVDKNRAFEDIISQKLRNFIESRVIQVSLSDDVMENFEISSNPNEGRKKKHGGGKHGGMMMGGKE